MLPAPITWRLVNSRYTASHPGSSIPRSGTSALRNVTTGSFNIAIGGDAGSGVTAGSNNIHIGHLGEAADSNVIRIGSGQAGTYLAGTVHATAFSGDGSALTGVTAVYK